MPAKRKSAKQESKEKLRAFYACQEQKAEARRNLCSHLMFWKACGHKKCLRARTCAVDANDCFRRLWPVVPEELKISIRTVIKAGQARLSKSETAAAIKRDRARWRAMAAPQATVEPAPPSFPIAPAASGPRLRVL